MNILLVRHGETDWNACRKMQGQQDIELNEKGKLQAKEVGDSLVKQNYKISKIYTSKQNRARTTASIIAKMYGLDPIVIDGLEEINLGQWEGLTWSEVENRYSHEVGVWSKNKRYMKVPGGESYQDVLERVIPAITEILNIESEDVLVVTHSAVIATILCFLDQNSFNTIHEHYFIGNGEIITLDESRIKQIQETKFRG